MANTSDEEADSRTALVGAPRPRPKARSTSRSTSHDSNSRPSKRQRRYRNKESDLADFVPRGGAFTANSLPVDPESTSSSGSSSSSNESSDSDDDSDPAAANPHAGNTAPAISWNQGRKAAVRTTLGKRSMPTKEEVPTKQNTAQFEAVNDRYWRSRSGSASSADGGDKPSAKEPSQENELEEGEVDSRSESDYSDSLGSEADDSILLNIGEKIDMDGANDYNPADLAQQHRIDNTVSQATGSGLKEEAFRIFSIKYPNAPTALVDLTQEDLEILAKYVYFNRNIHDLDLKLPITCIECHSEGHLADVCPAKECTHCGAWNEHQSSVCPSWRQCPRCLERGHDEPSCTSKLREIPGDQPCGNCNRSGNHLESQCPSLWTFPIRDLPSDQITVSISCAECGSSKHLVGDCDKEHPAFQSSSKASFTLNGIDPEMITNLNTQQGPSRRSSPPYRGSFSRGGRSGSLASRVSSQHRRFRSQSPDDEDMMSLTLELTVVAEISPETTVAPAHAHPFLRVVLSLEAAITIAVVTVHPRLHVVVGMETTIATARAHPRVDPLRQEVEVDEGPNVEVLHADRVAAAAVVGVEVEGGEEEGGKEEMSIVHESLSILTNTYVHSIQHLFGVSIRV
ncbi:uncharacterized protein N7515_003313 [Penicillium bovifimosum]|uniref:CCHC-type domain-containing protein n=1 Tax=Penicillium bovifimosum TaxID=126998 RepID=A0A9W9L635_9EURO|nr:uncharacterized protein N7515_003313 [Penicillium bovifimosum]KAJ5138465.1 hypothetical protein N7515_003313 [Penicillium bovifimosum]